MRWLGRIFAQAFARRIAFVIVALSLAALGVGRSEAQSCTTKSGAPGGGGTFETKQAAYEACVAYVSQWPEAASRTGTTTATRYYNPKCELHPTVQNAWRYVYFKDTATVDSGKDTPCTQSSTVGYVATNSNNWKWIEECPFGTTWNDVSKKCHDPAVCKSKPALSSGMFTSGGSGTSCVDGCQFAASVSVCTTSGDKTICSVGGATPTGQACAAGDAPPTSPEPKPQECIPVAGQSVCLRQDGKYCASASTGKQFCWDPGETGEQTDNQDKQRRDPGNTPQTPTPPPNGDTLIQSGQPVTTTTQVKDKNGTRNVTTTVTNYYTQNGTNAGTSNTGQPGDGTGKGGSGSSGGSGGSGSGDGEGDGAGAPGSGFGDGELYEGTDKTIASVYGDFKTQMMGSEFGQAFGGFLGTCQGGGSCPSASWEASDWGISLSLAELCTGVLNSLLQFAGWVFLAGIAFFSWKVAIL